MFKATHRTDQPSFAGTGQRQRESNKQGEGGRVKVNGNEPSSTQLAAGLLHAVMLSLGKYLTRKD